MRIVIVGASSVALHTAQLLVQEGHELVLVEADPERLEAISEVVDASLLQGDGSRPDVLREVAPETCDVLVCLTGNDQHNILASLVGRSLGFERIITAIEDATFEPVCVELGLQELIIPDYAVGRQLADQISSASATELGHAIRGEARFFTFVAGADEAGDPADLALPADAHLTCFYRGETLHLAGDGDNLKEGDEVVVLTRKGTLEKLESRFRKKDPQDEVDGDGEQ